MPPRYVDLGQLSHHIYTWEVSLSIRSFDCVSTWMANSVRVEGVAVGSVV
ncbi:MAG: hypothetical protein CM1200mP27_02690 [Chloroflexota bacterium]|nr:MAG: hypothetical protein CM1200mP27_02690 [Chloroflexota bacterium]